MTNKTPSDIVVKGKKKAVRIVFGRTAIIILLLLVQFVIMFSAFAGVEKYFTVAYGGLTVIAVIMAIYVTSTSDNPAVKLSWTALIIATPVFGALLYLYIQTELGHRLMNRKLTEILEETSDLSVQDNEVLKNAESTDKGLSNLASYTYKYGKYPIYYGEKCEYFSIGEKMFESVLNELEKAEKFIFMEYFIVDRGEMWDKTLEILKRKASRGVDVRLLYDGTCSISLLPSNYPKELAKYGIKCKVFSPLTPFVSTHYNNRDHRKILVIDGKTAYTGGVNFADEYINRKDVHGHWKDSGLKLCGEAVKSFTLMFLQMWNLNSKNDNYSMYLDNSPKKDVNKQDGYIIPYGDSPLNNERVGENIYMDIINTAKNYVYIMTPYLILDNEMITALTNAAKRGVDVRIIIPHVPDHKIAFSIAKAHCHDLVPHGVKIYEYTPGFIHSKVFVSDGIKAVVGTINLDYRSLYLHFECAAYIYGSSVTQSIIRDFEETFPNCTEILYADLKKRGIIRYLKTGILKLIAPLM